MNPRIAERLFEQLQRHSRIINPEKETFLKLLTETEVSESSMFYEELPTTEQILNEPSGERYFTLSLRRIIRNMNARESKLTGIKKIGSKIGQGLYLYSSTDLTRKLREDKYLMKLMEESWERSRNPFSLLGKLEEFNWNNPQGALYRKTTPILVIPEFVNNIKATEWEQDNAVYEKEVFFFKRRIKKQDYLPEKE